MVRRTASEAAATRERILAAARAGFARDGYAEASLERIAADAGVTRGALHHHFGDKRGLFVEVFTRLEHELNDAVAGAALTADPEGFAPMRAAIEAMFAACARPEHRQIVLADAPAVLGLPVWYEIDRGLGIPSVRLAMQSLADRGELASHLVEPLTILVYGGLTEAAVALATGVTEVTAEAVVAALEEVLAALAG